MTADNKMNFKEVIDSDIVDDLYVYIYIFYFFYFSWIVTVKFYTFLELEAICQKGTTWTGQQLGLVFMLHVFMLQNWKQ